MTFPSPFIALFRKACLCLPAAVLLFASSQNLFAASVRGYITDTTGARVSGANVALLSSGKVVGTAVSAADGSFQVTTSAAGRFFVVVTARSFRQLQTPDFYAGQFDSVERSLVLEPEWVRESIVVTATGTSTPQAETSASTTVLGPQDLTLNENLVESLRLMPGTSVVQEGERGAETSLFIRGGDSDNNKVLIDGVDAGDLGGQFDFSTLSATAIESAEIYRGPDSNLYGADAASGVISLTTPHGTTSFPSVLLTGEGGNFDYSREELQLAGAYGKLDYLGAFSWLQTSNSLPNDEYHIATSAANLGWQLSASTLLRGTLHYSVDATGLPNAWDFYHVADNATEKDQNLVIGGSIDNQTTAAFHNVVRYGATRKREETNQWSMSGSGDYDPYGESLGEAVTIQGANGYSATGQAVLDGATSYGGLLVNNRDELDYQGDYRLTPHLAGLVGFRFEDERGVDVYNSYFFSYPLYSIDDADSRTNTIYLAAVQGDFKNRFYYHLGGSLERYSLFGTQTSPRAGFSYYVLRPRSGHFNGTRVLGSFGDAVREPKLTDKFGSLYEVLKDAGESASIQEFNVKPLAAPTTRTYEAGFEQALLGQHLTFRASYFHNEFGRELEPVSTAFVSLLFPDFSATELQQLTTFFNTNSVYDIMTNTQAFRAQGVEAAVEGGIGTSIFLRGTYSYTDAVVQRSFSSDNEAQLNGYGFSYHGIPLGAVSPLVGARPFRRPPHSGSLTATYSHKAVTGLFAASFASRSDDSTFLEYEDENDGNSLLLPNRNLDFGFARLDLGGSYHLLSWLDLYGKAENLLSERHIAPIGYPSLPFNFRAGVRINWGVHKGR